MIITILIFIVVLGILVFVHEFGHFIVAKKSGMQVEEFGFGFPPRLFGIQKVNGVWRTVYAFGKSSKPVNEQAGQAPSGSTIYSINAIPLGGFVRILGENNENAEHPGSFINKGFWPRFLTLIAGVVMNVILAWVLLSVGYGVGLPVAIDNINSVPAIAKFEYSGIGVLEVSPGSPADKGGLKIDDMLLKIDDKNFSDSSNLREYIMSNAGKSFNFEIKRGENYQTVQVDSLKNPPDGQGPTGISLGNIGKLKYPWYAAAWEGAKTTRIQLINIVTGLGQLFTGKVNLNSLGGPVKIAQLTGQVAKTGFLNLLGFTAFLSLNLAVLNILPFPALDGGRVVFLLIEKIRRKKNNQKFEQIVNVAGFVFLLLLMVAVTINDVIRK